MTSGSGDWKVTVTTPVARQAGTPAGGRFQGFDLWFLVVVVGAFLLVRLTLTDSRVLKLLHQLEQLLRMMSGKARFRVVLTTGQ
jgi:hypothetical protein